MKLDVNYNPQEVEVLGIEKSQSFGFSKDAEEMIFTMFTKNIYSNPIGSVVREITSNCFDSHKEAGVTDAVVVKLTKEKNDTYISFIDNGVGMSRERITTVYAQYFNSTKRNDNNQIGGFGIGGKTPLAYADSFFLITRYNGTKYTYSIRKGQKSPVLDLLDKEKTTERNGTTVKIPVKYSDINTFEREIVRQLYYFENVIFEGFSQVVKNDYKIIEGKNFFYRGNDYNQATHICLGRVAYPIDYSVFYNDDNFDESEWYVPVALKIDIGEINVTVSREAIDYNEATKKLIKKKLLAAKEELLGMLSKQYEKLASLEEYYALDDNYWNLLLPNNVVLNIRTLTNDRSFKRPTLTTLNELAIPSQLEIIHKFYDVSMFGKKTKRDRLWDKSVKTLASERVYFVRNNEEMPRKKNAYMKATHKNFFSLKRANLSISEVKKLVKDITPEKSVADSKVIFNQFRELQKQVYMLVEKKAKAYSSIIVPDGFTVAGSKYDPNYEIPVAFKGRYGLDRERYKLSDLATTKTTIYYGTSDDEFLFTQYYDLYERIFKPSENKRFCIGNNYGGKPVRFAQISKSNVKYVTEFNNFKPISEFPKMLMRKRQDVIEFIKARTFIEAYKQLNPLFLNANIFGVLDADYAKVINKVKTTKRNFDKALKFELYVTAGSPLLSIYNIKLETLAVNGMDLIKAITEKTEKNGMLHYVSIYNDFDPKNNNHSAEEIKNIMQLLTLAYVK